MRSTEEQLKEIMKRADNVAEKKALLRAVFRCALATCACALLLTVAALQLPNAISAGTSEVQGHYGSLMLNTSFMGYVVVGLLAFMLGISVTMLCLRIRRFRKRERDRQ